MTTDNKITQGIIETFKIWPKLKISSISLQYSDVFVIKAITFNAIKQVCEASREAGIKQDFWPIEHVIEFGIPKPLFKDIDWESVNSNVGYQVADIDFIKKIRSEYELG